jgi:hypothetical protein
LPKIGIIDVSRGEARPRLYLAMLGGRAVGLAGAEKREERFLVRKLTRDCERTGPTRERAPVRPAFLISATVSWRSQKRGGREREGREGTTAAVDAVEESEL